MKKFLGILAFVISALSLILTILRGNCSVKPSLSCRKMDVPLSLIISL